MTDELDVLRSLRPDAVGPSAAITTTERDALVALISQSTEQTKRAEPVTSSPPRRRKRVAAILAVSLLGAGGIASAAGLIPDDVRSTFDSVNGGPNGDAARADDARLRASMPATGGGTVQLWSAPTTGGGECGYLRHLGPDDKPDADRSAAGVGCATPADGSSKPATGTRLDALVDGGDSQSGATIYGRAPAGATAVVIELADGTAVRVAVTADAWYLAALPTAKTPTAVRSVTARDRAGRALETLDFSGQPAVKP